MSYLLQSSHKDFWLRPDHVKQYQNVLFWTGRCHKRYANICKLLYVNNEVAMISDFTYRPYCSGFYIPCPDKVLFLIPVILVWLLRPGHFVGICRHPNLYTAAPRSNNIASKNNGDKILTNPFFISQLTIMRMFSYADAHCERVNE